MATAPDLRVARVTAFASLATLSTAQDLVRAVAPGLGAEMQPELVAEETLGLVATATARAVEFGLREQPNLVEVVGPAILETPFLYHDLLLGGQLIDQGAEGEVEVDQSVYARLERKMEFYGAHLPVGRLPGTTVLSDRLLLWMGRISPPGLPSGPQGRVEESGAVELLAGHVRLVEAFARRAA